jgi:hypothetical protein
LIRKFEKLEKEKGLQGGKTRPEIKKPPPQTSEGLSKTSSINNQQTSDLKDGL